MAGWLDDAATELGVERLSPQEIDVLLDLTRDVAHGTERRYAPLTAFLVGLHVGGERADRVEAVRQAADRLRQRLPDES